MMLTHLNIMLNAIFQSNLIILLKMHL